MKIKGIGSLLVAVVVFLATWYTFNVFCSETTENKHINSSEKSQEKLTPEQAIKIIEKSEASALLPTIKKYNDEWNNELNRILGIEENCGFVNLFGLDLLSDQDAILKQIDLTKSFLDELKQSHEKYVMIHAECDAEIGSFAKKHFSDSAAFLNGYHKTKNQLFYLIKDYYKVKKDFYFDSFQYLVFINSIKDNYSIEEDTMLFDSNEDLERVSNYQSKLKQISIKLIELEDKINSQ